MTTTTPPTHTPPVEHIRQLARDGISWTDAAQALGFGLLMAESFATLTHLNTQVSCQWLAQPISRRASKLQEQLDQLQRHWFTLNPQATPDHLTQLAELFTAWGQGNAEAQAEMTRKLKALVDTRPSATLLQLWHRQLRQARQPSFETYFQGLNRKRNRTLLAAHLMGIQPFNYKTPGSAPSTTPSVHTHPPAINEPITPHPKAGTHTRHEATPVTTTPGGKAPRHGGNASQRFQAMMGLQA